MIIIIPLLNNNNFTLELSVHLVMLYKCLRISKLLLKLLACCYVVAMDYIRDIGKL